MESETLKNIQGLERFIGFSIGRKVITYGQNEPHDEIFSYNLCLRFYDDEEGLRKAITDSVSILKMLIEHAKATRDPGTLEKIAHFCSLIGNMHYLAGDFGLSAGYFMKSLSYNKKDLTSWIELLFSLRALEEFNLFEKGIFNLEKLSSSWTKLPGRNLNQDIVKELIMAADS